MKRLTPLLLALLLSLSACADTGTNPPPVVSLPAGSISASDVSALPADAAGGDVSKPPEEPDQSADSSAPPETPGQEGASSICGLPLAPEENAALDQDGFYYDLEHVVLYLDAYGDLPSNYITKAEARELGWSGGSVEQYREGAAIGGDSFGNREGILPRESGRKYTECDLNTNGQSSRGAERLVFSNDGLYFHTQDHYESFQQVWVEDGSVVS
ncbi:MAG: hypothetical protein HFF50_06025 [Lawsonibacter sp.]|nr:hypothetical protein [Lawsonibacter sp.]